MELRFECPSCGKHLTATTDEIGISAPCPGCAETVTVPGPVSSAEPPPPPVIQAPSANIKHPQAKSRAATGHRRRSLSSRILTRCLAFMFAASWLFAMMMSAVICFRTVVIMIDGGRMPIGLPQLMIGRPPTAIAIISGFICGISAFVAYGYLFMRQWAWGLHLGLHVIAIIVSFLFIGLDGGLSSMLVGVFLIWFGGGYLADSTPVAASRK